ncbi:UDP-4-amino-4-deoxy-L-arabinose--oxoglutarate aminotransferase [bioreactor metagenome]|uniref:UDP-4-amino-4-deoxy-L-arabinose--oxoglutarate aminotransferase n=1 Tax=bioreactor metagenome TaxID=1076179 RepID=A0A644XRL2_9ZZZZ
MIPFSPPRIDQQIIDAVNDVLKSGWITTGPRTREFESLLKEYTSCSEVLCVNSASAGLELILRWFGVGPGDEVIVPAYTYAATANVVIHCGATPVFADSDPDDFNITVAEIRKNITPATKVIIPVDLAGFPCDYDAINELVDDQEIRDLFSAETENQQKLGRILVLSDAAHSIGATYKCKKAGALTDITVFSFHAVKNLTTAEGGAICLNMRAPFENNIIKQDLMLKSLHGQNKDAQAKLIPGNWKYDIVEPGFKCNMTDIQAAIGIVELKRYDDDMLMRRKIIFAMYSQILQKHHRIQLPVYKTGKAETSYHVFLLRIKDITEEQRDELIQEIFRRDVSVNVHFKPLPLMTYYKNIGYNMKDYPVAYDNFSREISLPVYYDLNNEQVQTVAKAVLDSINKICP